MWIMAIDPEVLRAFQRATGIEVREYCRTILRKANASGKTGSVRTLAMLVSYFEKRKKIEELVAAVNSLAQSSGARDRIRMEDFYASADNA
jgi:hypothetical protein